MQAYTAPPPGTVVVCLDECGPLEVATYPGRRLVATTDGRARARAPVEVDWGHRGTGYIFGALCPATGQVLTHPYDRRTGANWVDFLERVAAWLPPATHVVVVLDNLNTHKTLDATLFGGGHPSWSFCFQPVQAAWLNLIEPWWKLLRELGLAGRTFTDWDDLAEAVAAATAYWNAHAHPFVWGRPAPIPRKRRMPGVGRAPVFLSQELAA